jgi:hypothetical protein
MKGEGFIAPFAKGAARSMAISVEWQESIAHFAKGAARSAAGLMN